jgi:hypothetical protein
MSLFRVFTQKIKKESCPMRKIKRLPVSPEDDAPLGLTDLDAINRCRPQSLDQVKAIWYNGRDGSGTHYHDSRYHALNLHAVFSKGTVEYRLFNATLAHASKIKAMNPPGSTLISCSARRSGQPR